MSLSTLPVSYCTNVHPSQTLDELLAALREITAPAAADLPAPIAAGLWLPQPLAQHLDASADARTQLAQTLSELSLGCYTLNAFPFGNFHGARVKEQVYLPDWTQPDRRRYTLACARVLAELMPSGVEGSISTVPLGFKPLARRANFQAQCIDALITLASELDALHDDSGRVIRLAIEPEPCCLIETTAEAIEFFNMLFATAADRGCEDIARRHLGLCYDVCHQAVEFEDIAQSFQQIDAAGIRINKVHLTCALQLDQPRDESLRAELAAYAEPRYLHQLFARGADGRILHEVDLTPEFCINPPPPFLNASIWRVHFHVPVHRTQQGRLSTTHAQLTAAVAAVAALRYAPHLEVETYTWGVLPEQQAASLSQGLQQELNAIQQLLQVQHS